MAKIAILTGSPHNSGTSQQLADAFEKGAQEANNTIYRYDAGLQGKADPHFLQLKKKPGMEIGLGDNDAIETDVIPHLLTADIVVLVASMYYFGINAQLKAVIDRFYINNHQLKDKQGSIVLVSGYGSQNDMAAIKLQMQKIQMYMRWPNLGTIYADDSWNKIKLSQHTTEAYQLGKQIH